MVLNKSFPSYRVYFSGEWKIFAGNEMGALISWWAWMCWCMENPKGDASNVYILNSAVSSSIVKTMAAKEGNVSIVGFYRIIFVQ